MCGIVGYIGNKESEEILFRALSRLEYRGYDSAGIAAVADGKLEVIREKGKLKALYDLAQTHHLTGRLGIGHTRWATHGIPSQGNAHPHIDCTGAVAVVHNGIIENHRELRSRLETMGHRFTSDTDSEVIAHLIEERHIKEGRDLEESVRLTLKDLEGSYAICVISARDANHLIAARNGSPLVVGVGAGQNFIASDAPAIIDYTREAIFVDDYQMAIVTCDKVVIKDIQGHAVEKSITHIDWEAKDASKEGFDHFMLKEIEEQPKVLERILQLRLSGDLKDSLFDTLNFPEEKLHDAQRLIIQACGTSWHAALTAKFMFENLAALPTEVDVSSEFRYRHLIPQEDGIVLSITQSGETIDTLVGLREGAKHGYKTLSLCNVLGSTIARESDGVIYTHAGPEIGVASTKAYTAQLTALFLLALYWGRGRARLSASDMDHYVKELRAMPAKMRALIEQKDRIRTIAKKYVESRDFLFLGRGINYPNAHEGALKIKEIAYIHATGHPAGEMKHGPIALIDEHMPVVAIAPASATHEKIVSNIREVKARSGKVIAIATVGDDTIREIADDVIEIPACHEMLSPLLTVLPLQYLAYYMATLRGTDVDQPRNLAKSVTVE